MDQTLNSIHSLATPDLDEAFRRVSGLTWLPWVGRQLSSRPPNRRLLIVGESHYYKTELEREERLKNPTYTKEIVWEQLVHRWWDNKTLDNIPKLLFKTSEIDRSRLWSDSAYYNIMQRLMDYSQVERPTFYDFVEGWKSFTAVIRIVHPSHCLFIGVEAANSFNFAMTNQGVRFEKVTRAKQVGRTWARVARLEVDGKAIELIFVQHLGKYFSWESWHDYLQSQHSEFMSWLGAEPYLLNSDSRILNS